jgi:hypothetical protein
MPSATQTAAVSKKKLWAGRIISALPVLLLLFSGVMKLLKLPLSCRDLLVTDIPRA